MMAATASPGRRPWAFANDSLTSTSSGWPASIVRPARRNTSQSAGGRPAGIEISRPVAGSARPATSIVTSMTTRVSTCATPGIASISAWSDSGARVSDRKTSAKR